MTLLTLQVLVSLMIYIHVVCSVYFYSNGTSLNWNQAQTDCLSRNMELAKIDSQTALDLVTDYTNAQSIQLNEIWLGLKYDNTSSPNVYKWLDGEELKFSNWDVGEPDHQDTHLCVRMTDFRFRTKRCTQTYDYLCTDSSKPYVYRNTPLQSASYNDVISFDCPYHSVLPITSVFWEHASDIASTNISYNTNTDKYSGSTIATTSLTVKNVTYSDIGNYSCHVENAVGTGEGLPIIFIIKDYPQVAVPTLSYVALRGDSATLVCNVRGSPAVTTVEWFELSDNDYTSANTIQTVSFSTDSWLSVLTSTDLHIDSLSLSDSGNYTCAPTNNVGTTTSDIITLTVIETEELCTCPCDYQEKLDYWATHSNNYTKEEWQMILAPVVLDIGQNLTVDVNSLTLTKLKYTCAADSRSSSARIGVLGLLIIVLIVGFLIFGDVLSLIIFLKTRTTKRK